MILEFTVTQAMVAEELGICAQQIANWKRQFTRLSDKQFNSLGGVDYAKKESEEIRKLRHENKRLQKEMDFLKKAVAYFFEKTGVKFAIMRGHLDNFSKSSMCRALSVSRFGFNKWLNRPEFARTQRKSFCEKKVLETFEQFEAIYGAPRITDELNVLGFLCSENFIAKIMAVQGIRTRNGKVFKDLQHGLSMNNVSDNLLWRDFSTDKPNQKWTSDITYIWVKKRWLYLATVMDLYS